MEETSNVIAFPVAFAPAPADDIESEQSERWCSFIDSTLLFELTELASHMVSCAAAMEERIKKLQAPAAPKGAA